MAAERKGGGGGFLFGLVLGALAGAGAALMLAPRRGEEMRQQLMERGAELTGRATELTSRARQAAGSTVEKGMEYAGLAGGQVQQAAERAQEAAREMQPKQPEETAGGSSTGGSETQQQTPQ